MEFKTNSVVAKNYRVDVELPKSLQKKLEKLHYDPQYSVTTVKEAKEFWYSCIHTLHIYIPKGIPLTIRDFSFKEKPKRLPKSSKAGTHAYKLKISLYEVSILLEDELFKNFK